MNIKAAIILAAAAGSVAAVPASAQTRSGFEVGAEIYDYSYREQVEDEDLVFDDGTFFGVTASYAHRLGDNWFLRARTSFAWGSVDYSSDDGQLSDVPQDMGQLELHVGHDFGLGSGATLTAFTGVGGRVLNDHSGGEETESGFQGYDREVAYAYIPVGLSVGVPLGGGLSVAVSGQYNHVFGGKATSRFSELDPELPDIDLDLNGGSGFELSAMVSIPVGKSAVRIGPFLRRWDIDRSDSLILREEDLELEVYEPENRTNEAGVRLTFAF